MTDGSIECWRFPRGFRTALLALIVGVLSACGGSQPDNEVQVTAAPGGWDGHIAEASQRFRVPEEWIRAVMEVESGGRTHLRGRPITSHAGAMGLMQVMPATYQELRRAHNLGPDPHNPRDNILAGTAYLRQMYEIYGFPGFLGAYNAGPGRYGDHVNRGRGLPRETRNYMARIEPQIAHIPHPDRYDYDSGSRSQLAQASTSAARASSPAPATAPTATASATSSSRSESGSTSSSATDSAIVTASASSDSRPYWSASSVSTTGNRSATESRPSAPAVTPAVATSNASAGTSDNGYQDVSGDGRVLVASLESSAAGTSSGDVVNRWANNSSTASATAQTGSDRGGSAARSSLDSVSGPDWGVQVGAFRTEEQSLQALQDAARSVPGLGGAFEQVSAVTTADGSSLYRARLIGLTPESAADACVRLNSQGGACMLVTPS